MAKLLKLRRGTTTQHSSFTGAEGEVTVDTDKDSLVVHDGATAGGTPLARENLSNVASATITGRLGTGSIVKAKLEADIIDGTKLADDAVNSEHIADGAVDLAHMSVNSIDSDQYVDGSIDHEHLAGDCIDGDNIQDDVINSEHIAAGAVDLEHMSSQSVDEDNLYISNSGTNGQYLQKQSGNAGGLTWATVDLTSIAGTTFTDDVTFDNGTNAGKDIVWDESDNALEFKDHVIAAFGTGSDLKIYHDENHSYLHNATGELKLRAATFKVVNEGNSEIQIQATEDGAVDLYYNHSKKLETTNTGVSVTGNAVISGDLTVNGTTTTVATTNTTISDNLLELNSGAGSNANDCGLLIERGSTGDNAIIAWDESADKFTVGTTTGTASSTGNISITTGTLVADLEGDVTGSGASITSLNASQLSSGTIPDARFPSTLPAVSGANLTGIEAFVSGMILLWSGASNAIPSGFVICDGQNSTPDLRNKFVIGAGDSYAVGANAGSANVTIGTTNMPSHAHSFTATGNTGNHTHSFDPGDHTHSFSGNFSGNTSNTGGHSHSHTRLKNSTGTNGYPVGTGGQAGSSFQNSNTSNTGNHSHSFNGSVSGNTGNGNAGAGTTGNATASISVSGNTGNAGDGNALSVLNPYYALCYIMKT